MNFDAFVDYIFAKKVIIFGEWHQYIGDTAVVLRIADAFLRRGKRIRFYMEHFPSGHLDAIQHALDMAIGGTTWGDIDAFLDTPMSIPGKGIAISPLNAWTHTGQRWKLKAILRFAQTNHIPVMGHDVPYGRQVETYQKRGEAHHLIERDTKMSYQYERHMRDHPTEAAFGFVGEFHVRPQLDQFIAWSREGRGRRNPDVLGLRPDPRFVLGDVPRPIVNTTAQFAMKAFNFFEFGNPG